MITIVTDSSACFKREEALALGVRVVPINYSVGGRRFVESFADGNGAFEQLLRTGGKCNTWHPNMAAFLSCFEEETAAGREVLCVTMSSRLSGAYSTAYMAARQVEGGRVAVFDSQFTAGGLYLLVKAARERLNAGMSLDALLAELPAMRERVSVAFTVEDMAPLRRSGRLGFVRMSVGSILNLRPLLLCREGAVVSEGVVRGRAAMVERLASAADGRAREGVVGYIGNEQLAADLYHVLRERVPALGLRLQKMGPVLGIHLGLQVVGLCLWQEAD